MYSHRAFWCLVWCNRVCEGVIPEGLHPQGPPQHPAQRVIWHSQGGACGSGSSRRLWPGIAPGRLQL